MPGCRNRRRVLDTVDGGLPRLPSGSRERGIAGPNDPHDPATAEVVAEMLERYDDLGLLIMPQAQAMERLQRLGVLRYQDDGSPVFADPNTICVVDEDDDGLPVVGPRATVADLVEMAETRQYPVVVRTEIDYRRGARLGDRLRVDGWLDRVKRARFWCAFEIRRIGDETLIAECRQMLALIQMPGAKLLPLPETWGRYRILDSAPNR